MKLNYGGKLAADGKEVHFFWITSSNPKNVPSGIKIVKEIGSCEHVCGIKKETAIFEELKKKFEGRLGKIDEKKNGVLFAFSAELVSGGGGGGGENARLGERWPHFSVTGRVYLIHLPEGYA